MKDRKRRETETDRQTERERQTETQRHRERRGTETEKKVTERETDRQTETEGTTERAIASEIEREGGRESENRKSSKIRNDRHILCCKMYKTLHGIKHHTQSESTFTFCLIKPSQPFKQTRTSTTHNQTTFSLSLYIYRHISHSSQSYGQQ